MERASILVKAATVQGKAHFEFEQLDGELTLKQMAQFLELASQFIYKQFPHLKPESKSSEQAAFQELFEIVRNLAETMEECGYWPDTSHSQVKLGDLGREARALLDKIEGGAA